MSTKVYRNTTKETVNVLGIGEIPAGEQVSITTEYQPHVIPENYPGVIEVSEEVTEPAEVSEVEVPAKDAKKEEV